MSRVHMLVIILVTIMITAGLAALCLRSGYADTSRYNAKLDVLLETLPPDWPYLCVFAGNNRSFRMDTRSGLTWQMWPNGWRLVEEKEKQFTPQNTEFPGRYVLHEGSDDTGVANYRFDRVMGNTWKMSANGWVYVEDVEEKK